MKKLTLSGLVIACYIVMTFMFQGLSFGAIQIRLANSLYSLSFIYPFLVIPLALGVGLSNVLFGGLGLLDILLGSLVGLVISFCIAKTKKPYQAIPITVIGVGGLVPLWLSPLLGIPYHLLFISIALGQIPPALLGYIIIKRLSVYENIS